MRKVIRFIVAAILVLGFVFSGDIAFAENSIPAATNDFYVNDFAGVFSEEEKAQLLDKAINLAETKDGIQVVITTVESLNGYSIEDYAVAMYNQYGIGKDDMGVLILLSTGDRQIRIEVGYAMEAYITDSKAGNLIDKYAISYLRDNKFNEGLINLQDAVISEITTGIDKEDVALSQASDNTIIPVDRSSPISDDNTTATSKFSPGEIITVVLIDIILIVLIAYILFLRDGKNKLKSKLEFQEKDFEENKKQDQQNHLSEIQRYETKIKKIEGRLQNLKNKNDALSKEICRLNEFIARARKLHPALNSEISEMILKEEEEKNRQKAEEFDSSIKELLESTPSISIVPLLYSAFLHYNDLTDKQKAFVKSDISKLTALQVESRHLKEEDERKKKIARDKDMAREVQHRISYAISGLSYGSASNLNKLSNAYSAYSYLSSDAKKYVDSSLVSRLNSLFREAKQDKERIDEEKRRLEEETERRRRQREEEERRRRSQSSFNHSSSHSSFGGSSHHGGFGGHSGGGGASRGF